MATKSVATKVRRTDAPGSEHDLFIRDGRCLTVRIDRGTKGFPPDCDVLNDLNTTLVDLGKAVGIIGTLLEDGLDEDRDGQDQWNVGKALSGLAGAIVLHATLAEGVNTELRRDAVSAAQGV